MNQLLREQSSQDRCPLTHLPGLQGGHHIERLQTHLKPPPTHPGYHLSSSLSRVAATATGLHAHTANKAETPRSVETKSNDSATRTITQLYNRGARVPQHPHKSSLGHLHPRNSQFAPLTIRLQVQTGDYIAISASPTHSQ